MKAAARIRGTALPETALIVTTGLLLTFGILQIGKLGYLQLMTDGAAFIAAHEYSLGNTTTYNVITSRPFPLGSTSYVDQKDPASASVPVNYETMVNRAGGVTLLRPNPSEITQHLNGGGFGIGVPALSNIDVHGSAIEPDILMSNQFYDVKGLGYAGAGDPTTFFGSRLDTPYYYASAHRLLTCTAASFGASTCPAANLVLRSLGTAEYLDRDNWARGGWTNFSFAAPWAEMVCHERNYAQAESTVFASVATPTQFSALKTAVSTSVASGDLATIYGWDATFSYDTAGTANAAYGSVPLQPANHC